MTTGSLQPFGHELHVGPVLLEPVDQRVVGDPVDGVDGVGGGRALDRRHVDPTSADDDVAHVVAELAQEAARLVRPSVARSSAAFSSGSDSLVIEPPPISGPARYFSRPGARSGGCSSTWNG